MRRLAWLGVFCALALAVACGGKTEAPGAGGSGGSTGGSGGTTGGSGGTGGSSATGGAGGSGGLSASCQKLDDEFKLALAEAKACNMLVNSLQCTLSVGDDIQCPCPTYVNPGNGDAIDQLNKLQAEWQAQGCNKGIVCAGAACPAPQGSGCTPSGAGGDAGKCTDFWPD